MSDLAISLAVVRDRIAAAARRAGRDPDKITLVAVTKTQPPEVVREALSLGVTDFGENRVEAGAAKIQAVKLGTWHMIGHVQSRKAREVAAHFDWVHSVDRAPLAERLGRAVECGGCLPALIECNVSGEESKYGLRVGRFFDDPEQRAAARLEIEHILEAPGLEIRGLMTMAPLSPDPEAARPVFQRLRRLRDEFARQFPQREWRDLSMGMTDDFEVAIEAGATLVRIGRAIFGERRV